VTPDLPRSPVDLRPDENLRDCKGGCGVLTYLKDYCPRCAAARASQLLKKGARG
jgi:hypothetical protein